MKKCVLLSLDECIAMQSAICSARFLARQLEDSYLKAEILRKIDEVEEIFGGSDGNET